MAEWRARGYVVDSDEEEDSQTFVTKSLCTSKEAQPHIDDIGAGEAEGHQNGKIRADGAVFAVGGLQDAGITSRVGDTEEDAVDDGSRSWEQDRQQHDRLPDSTHADGGGYVPIEDFGDIDETQEAHYKATPSAQLEGGLKGGATRTLGSPGSQGRSFARRSFNTSSASSSPLSTLSSPLGTAPASTDFVHPSFEHARPGSPRILTKSVILSSAPPNLSPPYEQTRSNGRSRSLRHRNAIQLHPYLVESERYRQTLKARGLRPLRMAQESACVLEDESQNAAYNGEESQLNDVEGDMYSPPPVESQNSSTKIVNRQNHVCVLEEDELPDMDSLLQNPLRKYVGNGYKRRKTASATFNMRSGVSSAQQGPMVVIPMMHDDDGVFDVPPSPPYSGAQTPNQVNLPKKPKFRMPKGPSPVALPTPVTSSEPRRRVFADVSDDESADDRLPRRTQSPRVSEASDAGVSTSEDESSHHLQGVQRRIRGVLPASWLKLDLKSQKKRSDASRNVQTSLSPERISMQRGVARPVSSSRNESLYSVGSRDGLVILSDQTDSDSANGESPRKPDVNRNYTAVLDDDDLSKIGRLGEAPEDDQIDAMLPTASRDRAPRRAEKKQRKPANIASDPSSKPSIIARKARNQRKMQPRITDQFEKGHKRKPAFHTPKLSILDAPSRKSSSTPVPRFLKIASRTARSRNDKGRHSPSRKYIRLATRNDDNETYETLRNWREGTIVPLQLEQATTTIDRLPLHARSGNTPLPLNDGHLPHEVSQREPIAVKTVHTKTRPRFAESRDLQTSLDRLYLRQKRDRPDIYNDEDQRGVAVEKNSLINCRKIVSSLKPSNIARPAMLESAQEGGDESHAQALFQRDLARIDHFDDRSGLPNVLRLFEEKQRPLTKTSPPVERHRMGQERSTKTNAANRKLALYRPRKRRPQRMEVPAPWSRRSETPIILDDLPDEVSFVQSPSAERNDVLIGLGSFGTRYSVSFDTNPLPTGICFHNKTVLGSGSFARSLKLSRSHGLDSARGFTAFIHNSRTRRWGLWNDNVSSELGEVMESVKQVLQDIPVQFQQASGDAKYAEADLLLRTVVTYFSDHLSFSDPIDRLSCVQRSKTFISTLAIEVLDHDTDSGNATLLAEWASQQTSRLRFGTLILIFANEVRQVADHEILPRRLLEEVNALVHTVAQKALRLALRRRLQEFEDCLLRFKDPDPANYILDQQYAIEAFIVAHHVYRQQSDYNLDVLQSLQDETATKSVDGVIDVRGIEMCWKQLFILLPFLEFDTAGTLETGRRFTFAVDSWPLVKGMVSPVLETSLKNPRGQLPSFNGYCRSLFARCLHLINYWGWRRCDFIIGTLFDFFARNNLGHLRNEESHGSPIFLEQLDKKPALHAEPEDRCFHILLKIIGSGIKHMRQLYPEKKIRDIVWRLMPNHGRSHPKEEAIRQEDLDALRNHHDLLCTLYWASPPSCRPRLTVIRNLVHLENSHREACHINIRAWLNLVKFQLSTDEPMITLEPFAEWHNDLLQQLLRQHALARTEAEEQVRSVQYTGGLALSNELLESTIAKNQRQVEAMLDDTLVSLHLTIVAAPIQEAATLLMSPSLSKIFELFDARRSQAIKTVVQALGVLSAYASKISAAQNARDESDESQDYGDWTAFDDDNSMIKQVDETSLCLQTFQQPLRHLLSNCFGADQIPEDAVLLRLVEVWVAVAQVLVRGRLRSWSDYVDRFGNETWNSLRDTEQTRKYTAYFLATLIKADGDVYHGHQNLFLISWFGSLVERESLLKFQHRFTEALLNAVTDSPLLKNLPFFSDSSTGRFRIIPVEFSERRLSLISSVLSNMRVALEQAVFDPAVDALQLRQQYKDLLKHLMSTMKHNYQELGQGSNVKGSYVGFVHRVVEFLQQHTSMICPIDRFFTDNGAFPLPAADPTYVVGQLRNYASRLHDPKTPKQLASFLQSVSERAAIDGQQPYLVSQLHTAMSNAFENGVSERPTLRSFIIRAIVPAYTGLAFTTKSGWIPVLPYLQALRKVFDGISFDLDGCNTNSVNAVASIITSFLDSVRRSLGILLYPSRLLEETRVLKIVSAYYSAIIALLPTLDYLARLDGATGRAISDIDFLRSFAIYTSTLLRDQAGAPPPDLDDNEDSTYADTLSFATQELRDTLTKNWVSHGGQYYIIRGGSRREVIIEIGLFEEEKQQLFDVFEDFHECLGAMPALGDDDDHDRVLVLERRRDTGPHELFP